LDPIAALLIRQLTKECCQTTELVERTAALLRLELDEELGVRLQQTLSQLDELGLVEPVIP
jgi:hypothetical protein